MNIPKGHQGIIPYLAIEDATKFMEFVQNVFDAETTFKTVKDDGSLGHCEVQFSECTIMFTGSNDQCKPAGANLFVYVEDADATYAQALTQGATNLMPPADQEYGRSGGVRDPFGNEWWITSVSSEQ